MLLPNSVFQSFLSRFIIISQVISTSCSFLLQYVSILVPMVSTIDQYQQAKAVKVILQPADTECDIHRTHDTHLNFMG